MKKIFPNTLSKGSNEHQTADAVVCAPIVAFSRKFSLAIFSVFFIAGISILSLFLGSCSKDPINSDPGFKLSFSTDTLMFDTIFSSIGTTTRMFLVHNTSNQRIKVDKVRLARGSSSPFRINIDGIAAFEVNNLEIGANDSAYIFVKATIDPQDSDAPLIQTDSIVFMTNGNQQDVKLVAWGQDAHFYSNDTLTGSIFFGNDKPHVIYGDLIIDSLGTLNIEAGARLFFHNNSGLLIRNGARIESRGTLEEPVLFRGDRLDHEYDEIPGQWLGIEIEGQSKGNYFEYTNIINGKYGIAADSSDGGQIIAVTLYNCMIHNMVNYGILSIHSNIKAFNSRITNCGGYAVAIMGGGNSEFRHCTIANYWSFSTVQYPSLLLSNYIMYNDGSKTIFPLESSYFGNCIISGREFEQIEKDSTGGVSFLYNFDHCLLRTELNTANTSLFNACVVNKDVNFKDPWKGYFELDTLSAAKDAGWMNIIESSSYDLHKDLLGNLRDQDLAPDLGCFERKEE